MLCLRRAPCAAVLAAFLAGCSGAAGPAFAPTHAQIASPSSRTASCSPPPAKIAMTLPHSPGAPSPDALSTKYIKHIVILVQENRSFDNFFATFPGADGATSGKDSNGNTIPLKPQTLAGLDINHNYATYLTDYDCGKMDGFNLAGIDGNHPAKDYPYHYVDPAQIQPYWTLAQQYVLADHMFQTQGSGSFTAHQDLIAGTTAINSTESLIDYPSNSTNWGCNAKPSTVTSLLTVQGQYLFNQGPFPCLTYPTGTLRDLLDAKHVGWKYYAPAYESNTVGTLWNAFAASMPSGTAPIGPSTFRCRKRTCSTISPLGSFPPFHG